MVGRLTDEQLAMLEQQARDVLAAIEATQDELKILGQRRREVLSQLAEQVGQTEAARRLGMTKQAFWNVMNPNPKPNK